MIDGMSPGASPAAVRRRSYAGPGCPRCGGYLDLERLSGGEMRCPSCNGRFLAASFQPPAVRERVVSTAEAGPDGAAPCAMHPGNAAVGNCTRCGVFLCALCRMPVDGQELCPGCFDRLTSEQALSTARIRVRDYRGMALSLGVFGLLVSCFGLITGPLTLFLVSLAVRQRRLWQERGGTASLVMASLFALVQIGISILFLIGLFVQAAKAGPS
jgi:ribosomal protein L37AE/L43A